MNLPIRDDYKEVLRSRVTLLDVRAPIEFDEGAFGASVNIPLLDDEGRARVGKRYKDAGQDAAIELGHQIVGDDERALRVSSWSRLVQENPGAALYCARGGLRSQLSQQWLSEAGLTIPRVLGGYKALRNFGIEELDRIVNRLEVLVVGGRTGAAKTRLIHRRTDAVDLEGLANHRGSAFGRWPDGQPVQPSFENALVCELMDLEDSGLRQLVFEDEGKNVGHVSVPLALVARTSKAPLVVIEATVDERVEETITGYITESLAAWQAVDEARGFELFEDALLQSVDRIRKRLGSERHVELRQAMSKALVDHRATGNESVHAGWIRSLLINYYDPMYDYQLESKRERIVFSGSIDAVGQWLDHRSTLTG